MSFSQTAGTPGTALLEDWLDKVGVSVPRLRTDAKAEAHAYEAERAKLAPLWEAVDAAAKQPHPLVAAALAKFAYEDTGLRMGAASAAGDYPAALKRMQEKARKAAMIQPIVDYLGHPNAKEQNSAMQRANLCIANSAGSPVVQRLRGPYDVERAKQAAAEAAGDWAAASTARSAAGELGRDLAAEHDHMFAAERLTPLIARVESLIATDKKGRIPDKRRKLMVDIIAGIRTCQATSDFSTWESLLLNNFASWGASFVADFSGQTAEDWFNAGIKSPSGMKKAYGRMLGKPKSSQFAALKGLSESKKIDALSDASGESRDKVEREARAAYKDLKTQGLDWDVTPVELAAIRLYTGPAYTPMNARLRDLALERVDGVKRTAKPGIDVLIAAACDGLAKLPAYDRTGFPVFRFEKIYGNNLKERYQRGTTFTINDFWSTGAARGAAIATECDAEIVIFGKQDSLGKNVGPVAANKPEGKKGVALKGQGIGEVLFPPGCKFETVACTDLGAKGVLSRLRNVSTMRYRIEVKEV